MQSTNQEQDAQHPKQFVQDEAGVSALGADGCWCLSGSGCDAEFGCVSTCDSDFIAFAEPFVLDEVPAVKLHVRKKKSYFSWNWYETDYYP